MGALTTAASVTTLVALFIYVGFDDGSVAHMPLVRVINASRIIFIINVCYGLTLNYSTVVKQNRVIKWVVDIAILVTLLPLIYPRPEHPWIEWLDRLLYSRAFLFAVVGTYSVVDICYALFRLMGRRANPSMILSVSFLFFIIIGSFVLMMPRCLNQPISYIDSLFVSTSAVCITGLTPVDISVTFTPFGQLVLALLIQIGGLGVMTFTSFFALFFQGNTSIYSQLMVKDMVQSKSINSLLPTLLYILGFTLVIEACGAMCILWSIHGVMPGMSTGDEVVFAAFHSLSAFCNAGFSTLPDGMATPALMNSSGSIYLVMSCLIIAGGLGFPILVNIKDNIASKGRQLFSRLVGSAPSASRVHIYDINTKIVLVTTSILFIVSTLSFLAFEWNNSLAGLDVKDKVIQSFFTSCNMRSAGFTSVNYLSLFNYTIIMMMLMMWIGGGSQSLAGGIKVNTFATMLINLKATLLERKRVTVFNRTVDNESVRRAGAVIGLSILSLFVYIIILISLEPVQSAKGIIYEAVSALFNVGSSLDITPHLSDLSKIVVCTAMFLGRVGLLSLLIGITGRHREKPVLYPAERITIN